MSRVMEFCETDDVSPDMFGAEVKERWGIQSIKN